MFIAILTLLSALSISAVAIYYSIAGLAAIFAGAAIPIMIMGSVLEVGKLITASWLYQYWKVAPRFLKYYLSIAVIVLMFITSMGIFGYLSKAHVEQTSKSTNQIQEISRIENEVIRLEGIITRAEIKIEKAESSTSNNDDQVQKYQVKEEAFPRQLHCKACGQDSGFLIGGTSVVVNPRRLPKKDQAWLK